jgi:hypothetical protein
MVAKASLAFFRSDFPNRAPLTFQLVSYLDFGVSRSMMTPTKCSHSGPDFLTAAVIADSIFIFEIDCLIDDFANNPTPHIVKHWTHAGAQNVSPHLADLFARHIKTISATGTSLSSQYGCPVKLRRSALTASF